MNTNFIQLMLTHCENFEQIFIFQNPKLGQINDIGLRHFAKALLLNTDTEYKLINQFFFENNSNLFQSNIIKEKIFK